MWPLNDANVVNTYETNDMCLPNDYTLSSQWEFNDGCNYSEHEIDLASVLMNLKDDYPAYSCNNQEEYYPAIYDEQQQWHSMTDNEPPQRVPFVYNSMDINNCTHSTGNNFLLPAILDEEENYCKMNVSSIEKKRAGRPRGTKIKRSKAEPKLSRIWEFIRDLLLNSQYCPMYICWENYEEGRFRFVQSDKVAKLWGKFKRNERMNYEKFSRAMRYYYKTGVLLPVQGKRLVYKFGPKATGWHTDNPNFKYSF